MKKVILCCLFLSFSMTMFSQDKTVVSVERLFAKPDKVAEFEKALAAHAQKYHTGDWKWRVSDIQSGPDAGGYAITEGPLSWTTLDSRGTLGAEHTADYQKNIAPFTTDRGGSSYMVFRADLSTTQAGDFTDKVSINHIYPKPGWGGKVEANFKRVKKVWEAAGQTVAIYQSHFSGETQYIMVNRHKQGWKEKEANFRKPLPERYNAVHGEGAFDEYMESIQKYTAHSYGEMIMFRPDLSSK
jgi:hypothetical protein